MTDRALVNNAADPRQIRKAKQTERFRRQQELNDLRHVLETRPGRRFVWRSLATTGVFRLSFTTGEPDTTNFNEGRRSVGLALMAQIHELDPSFYMTMAKEAADDEQKSEPAETSSKPEETEDA